MKRDWDFMVAMEYNLSLLIFVGLVHESGSGSCQQCRAAGDSKEGSHEELPTGSYRQIGADRFNSKVNRGLLALDDPSGLFVGPREVVVIKDESFLRGCRLRWGLWDPFSSPFDQLFMPRVLCEIGSFLWVGSMVIKFPFSSLIMNGPMVKSPH